MKRTGFFNPPLAFPPPSQDTEKSRKLQQLEVPILDSEECHKHYMNHSGGVSKQMFCAGFPAEKDKDSCTVSCPKVLSSQELTWFKTLGY